MAPKRAQKIKKEDLPIYEDLEVPVASILKDRDLDLLVDSGMIKVHCKTHRTLNNTWAKESIRRTIQIPEVLACAVSSRFRHLCTNTPRRTFSPEEVVDEPIEDFEGRLYRFDFYTYMAGFVKWIYGASHYQEDGLYFDHWYLGQQIGSPRYQNMIICYMTDTGMLRDMELKASFWSLDGENTLYTIWEQADHDSMVESGDDWQNRRMLRFALDVMAKIGIEDEHVKTVMDDDGETAMVLGMIMAELDPADRGKDGPWEKKNLHKYLLAEKVEAKPPKLPRVELEE